MMELEEILRALGDNTRLRIVNLLLGNDELCVCELTAATEMAQPKVSRHLGILREAGLVLDRREGLWVYYRIHPDLPDWAEQLLHATQRGCRGKAPYLQDLERLASLETAPASCNT